MSEWLQDFRFAARVLRKNPGYAIVAILTLALGIGANTAVFSLVNGVLLRPLPYEDPGRLVRVHELSGSGQQMQVAWRNFVDWRERSGSFTSLVAHTGGGQTTVLGTGSPIRTGAAAVSEGFLRALGVTPVAGRDLLAEEHRVGADPATIVSNRFWRTYLGADPQLESHRIEVGGFDARIVGVAPPGFDYPTGADIWYPIELSEQTESRTAHNYRVIGRLGEGTSRASAKQELDVITDRFLEEDPTAADDSSFESFFPRSVRVEELQSSLVGDSRRPLLILLGASTLLLLVACTNLASTGMARGARRRQELAVRQALGAGGRRLTRLLFAEALTLTVVGTALGLALASAIVRVVPLLAPDALPAFATFELDPRVLVFTIVIAGLTAVLFGLAPAMRSSRGLLAPAITGAGRGGGSRARTPLWRFLIASEVALSIVLMIGCGLLVRSFVRILQVEPGFQTRDILLATFNPPTSRYPTLEERGAYYERLLGELDVIPGVEAVGYISVAPMGGISNGIIDVEGGPAPAVTGDYQLASAETFAALGIPLIQGRLFDGTERPETGHVAIVSRAFADEAWPGDDPIGKRITSGGMDNYWNQEKWATVVGVVGDIRQRDLTRAPALTYYFPYSQRPFRSWGMTAVIRPEGAIRPDLGPTVREIARSVDSDVPVTLATIEDRVATVVAERRFTLLILAGFAGLALLLAAIGIYGVVAYAVALRTREIGIRIALGARPSAVRTLVQRDTLSDIVIGGAAGILMALALTRVMQSLLFEVSPTDPLTFIGVVVALGAVGWLAAWVPARRSTRIDPVRTMREE
ncbi:MAG: ABC transporter permease [Gemmatimonadota bacterium]|nr:ABC transporter permease [Gemmatimonadota bacterium]